MTVHVLGCGPSGETYKANGDRCIAVNDAYKFGEQFSDLLLINAPLQFTLARLDTIRRTPAARFVILHTLVNVWKQYDIIASEAIEPQLMPGPHALKTDKLYFTNNSTFTAMTYAVTQGAKNVVLHGVDFDNHRFLRFADCAPDFTRYAQWARQHGIRVFKSSSRSRLVLEIWKEN